MISKVTEQTRRTTAGPSASLFGWAGIAITALFVSFIVILIAADFVYIDCAVFLELFTKPFILHALWMSLWTSAVTVLIALLFAVPIGYTLSRHRFRWQTVVDTVIDLPAVFPPLVAGLTLLVFFSQTFLGRWIEEDLGIEFVFQPKGIVLCQFFVSASYAIRSAKVAFDEVDSRFEKVALTLGCTEWQSFRRVTLPLAKGGVIAGCILTWARAFGLFGPLMVFVGSFRGRTEVLSTTIFLEQSIGNIELALAVALLMIAIALVALSAIRAVGSRSLVKL